VDTLFVALRVIVSLAVVVGLLWMVQRRVTKGSKRVRANKLVTVVTRQGIAQKASVVVVDMGGQRFLLGVTEHSVTVLDASEVPVEEVVPVPEALEGATTKESTPSSASGTGSFEAALTTAKKNPLPTNFTGFDPKTGQPRRGALDGSIISPATWRRAASALRSSK
jgi:flagellar protein FliO/FliZ